MAHKNSGHVTLFSIDGTNLLADVPNAQFIPENKVVESKGLGTLYDDPEIVGKSGRIEFDCEVTTAAVLTAECVNDGYVTFDLNTGANRYQGNGVITTAPHTFERDNIQMQKCTLLTKGAVTIS